MRLRSSGVALVIAGVFLLLSGLAGRQPSRVEAAGVLDATFAPSAPSFVFNVGTTDRAVGETFVVGHSGRMDRVGLLMMRQASGTDFQFELYAVSGGLPTGAPLATAPSSVAPGPLDYVWHEVTFATPPLVTAGQRYALMARYVSGMGAVAVGTPSDAYAGGQAVAFVPDATAYPEFDFAFRVYIETLQRYNLTATATPNPVVLNQTLTYTFTATNTGTGEGPNTVLMVDLPSVVQVQAGNISITPVLAEPAPPLTCQVITLSRLSCVLGTVAAGHGYVVVIPVRIISTTLGAQLCARGTLTGGTAGAYASTTAQACARTVLPPGDLAATIDCPTTARDSFNPQATCSVTVRNSGGTSLTVLAYQVLVRIDFDGSSSTGITANFPLTPTGYYVDTLSISTSPIRTYGWMTFAATVNDTIPAGGTRVFPASFATFIGATGTHSVTATVDPYGVIAEGNEGNNSAGPVTTTISAGCAAGASSLLEVETPLPDGMFTAWARPVDSC